MHRVMKDGRCDTTGPAPSIIVCWFGCWFVYLVGVLLLLLSLDWLV